MGDVQVSVGGVALVPAAPHHSGKIYRVTRIPGTNIPGIGIDVGGVVLRDCDYELEVFPPTGAGGVRMYNLMINVTAPTDTELKLHAMFAAMTPPVVHGRQCIAVTINSMLSSVQTWWTLRTTRPGVHTYHLRGVMP